VSAAAGVLSLESRLVNAWPSFETQLVDGWLLRFANGYSKRANSASPIVPGAMLDREAAEQIERQFRVHRLPAIFRLTGLEDAAAGAFLRGRGYADVEPSYAMSAAIDGEVEEIEGVVVTDEADPAWIKAAAAAYGGEKDDAETLGAILGRIRQPSAYATLVLDDRPVGWGFGVAERGYVGLYDIVVAPDLRGLGLGRQVVRALMEWGRSRGAGHAYLQVRKANDVARALYASLGFGDVYRYTHLVKP
jgi:ribosomal protein S18 acetylase RimI-like enzyme